MSQFRIYDSDQKEFIYGNPTVVADYVVVGVGSAGSVFAKLLSDDLKTSVIGIEAGQNLNNDPLITDSTMSGLLPMEYFSKYFYQNVTIPQANAGGAVIDFTGGRLLGGSSSINGMQYVRGSDDIYNQWETLTNDSKWGSARALELYKSFEKFNGTVPNPAAHGFDGPMDIRLAPAAGTSMADKFCAAINNVTDVPLVVDHNDPDNKLCTFTQWQLYQYPDGSRTGGSFAYLNDDIIDQEGNGTNGRKLQIYYNAYAMNLIFNGTAATGVNVLYNSNKIKVMARKKVIVCLGVHTPEFLLRSGIGPRADLEAAGVTVVADNAHVGQNLVNQVIVMVTLTANPDDVALPLDDLNALYVGGAFIADDDFPTTRQTQLIGIGLPDNQFAIAVIPLQPKSAGAITVQSNDPTQVPLVDDAYFTDPEDLPLLMRALRTVGEIATAMHAADGTYYELVSPTSEVMASDDDLKQWIFDNLDQCHHWTSSCRMADSSENGAADSSGNVYGVQNLIVGDCSAAPCENDGNTSSIAYLIALNISSELI